VGLVDLRTEAPRLLGVIGGLWLAHVDPPALPEVRASVGRMTAAGDAGRLVESVRAEHVERPAGWIGGTYEMHARCELDGCRWPCGAVQVAEALERESARAERLAGYARHKSKCTAAPYEPHPGYPCSCGLSAALGLAAGEGESDD
jgi:hypothetical protein